MNAEKVSVIVPVYNEGKTIAESRIQNQILLSGL